MKHRIITLLAVFVLTLNVMPAMAAEVEETAQEQMETDMSVMESESNVEADENGFLIIDGVLIGYMGNATKIEIPNSVTKIGDYAFQGRSALASVSLPDSIAVIPDGAFAGCSALTDIRIPESVTIIGAAAFAGCSSLTSINLPDNLEFIGSWAFEDCIALTSIHIPDHLIEIPSWAFAGCSSLSSITIPNGSTYIGGYAFENCNALISIRIPNSVTDIDVDAFEGCDSLTIYGEEDSYAQKFANENNIPFRLIGSEESTYIDENGIEKRKITAGKNGEITLVGDSKVLPQGARFKVERLGSGSLYDKAAEALKKELKNVQNYTVFEMTLLDSTNVEIHELEDYVSVTIPISEGMLTGNGKTLVVYRLDNGTLTKCETTVADGNVTFLTNHFSTYVFTETDAENTMGAGTSGQNSQNNQNSQKKSPLTGDPGFSIELDLTDILLLEGIVVVGGLFVTVCYWSICGRKRKR